MQKTFRSHLIVQTILNQPSPNNNRFLKLNYQQNATTDPKPNNPHTNNGNKSKTFQTT